MNPLYTIVLSFNFFWNFMIICHVTAVHPRYDSRIFHKQCMSLIAAQFTVNLIVADGLGNEIIDQLKIFDCTNHKSIKSNNILTKIRRILFLGKPILKLINQINPAIVHLHDPELLLLVPRLHQLKIKIIYDSHEDLAKQILNKIWIPKFMRKKIASLTQFYEQTMTKYLAGVIGTTDIISDRFKTYGSKSITIFNYPIITEVEDDVKWSQRNHSICYIGSIALTRGIIPLLDSLSIYNTKCELAGIFSNPEIEHIVRSHPNWNLVNYHGILTQSQIHQLLNTVKVGIVTLLPTASYLESLPIKLFEYMNAAIPVVASNFPLWQSLINGCGIGVNPHDASAIAKAYQYYLTHDQIAEQQGIFGAQKTKSKFSWQSQINKLLNFYQQL